MAKVNSVQNSTKIFGGNKLAAGRYIISDCVISEETFNNNGVDTKYECLQINVLHTNPTTGMVMLGPDNQPIAAAATLSLNGIWRSKTTADGSIKKNSGSMFDELMQKFRGKTFSEVRDLLNASYKNKSFTITYDEFVGENGPTSVMVLNWA